MAQPLENPLRTPIQFIKGIGPGLGAVFQKRGLKTVWDLISFLPKSYQDRSEFIQIKDLTEGESVSVSCTIKRVQKIPIQMGRKFIFEALAEDGSGVLSLKWFHYYRGMEGRFKPGSQLVVTGKPKKYQGRFEIVHPEVSFGEGAGDLAESQEAKKTDTHVGRIVPFYVEIEGISSRIFRKVIWNALEKYAVHIPDEVPLSLLKKYGLPRMKDAIMALHFPPNEPSVTMDSLNAMRTPFQQRFIFDEFFKFEFMILKKRMLSQKDHSLRLNPAQLEKDFADLQAGLPFQLTRDQHTVILQVLKDFLSSTPMNRLLQGDVGSGKTVVGLLSAAALIAQGSQCVLMAPTEILAEQHLKTAKKFFSNKLTVLFLTGSTSASERVRIQEVLQKGIPCLLVGTHAVFEDPIQFKNLDLVMIDEQHRFGVDQRRRLIEKGNRAGLKPHVLVMTATPIPRTLALTVYGDLSVSILREKPPGRTPIRTHLVKTATDRKNAYQTIREQLKLGRQAYFIFPLVDESEAEGFEHLKSVMIEAEKMKIDVFPDYTVGILHGKLTPSEKTEIMARFQKGEIHVLVSTTVVEVGVDVPNSTIMAIEHAERFGLSQLHQLRGRVGRGSLQSYCYLMTHSKLSEVSEQRLSIMEKSEDGFYIAEEDLKIRGPGEFLGTRQSGALPFVVADLVRDAEWLYRAREEALAILKHDPTLSQPENACVREYARVQRDLSV